MESELHFPPERAKSKLRLLLLAVLLAVGFIGRGLLPWNLPVPVDEVARGYPYRALFAAIEPSNPLTNDTVKQMLPWMQVVREQLAAGELPLWNPYAFGGYPLLGNGQAAPFSPFFLLTLFVPLPWQIVAMGLLKLVVAFVFTYSFARDDGRSVAASFFAAVVFTFSVFMTVYLYYPMTAVTALLPLLLWSVRRTLRSSARRWPVLVAITTAAALAGGHPESVIHLAFAAVLLLAFERGSGLARACGAALAGALLSAPAWLPVAELALASERAAVIRAAGGVMSHDSLSTTSAFALLNPNGFGHPARGTWGWIYNYSIVAPSYAGLVTLALLAGAFACRNRRPFFYALTACATFIVAMNWTVLGRLVNALPPLSFCANDRLRFVTVFFAAVAGAWAVDELRRRVILLTAVAGLLLACASAWVYSKRAGISLEPRDLAGIAALLMFLIGGALAVRAGRRELVPVIAAVCATAELFIFNTEFNAVTDVRYFRPPVPMLEHLRSITPEEPFRIVGYDWMLLPNGAAQYGLEDVRGSDPMAPAAYTRFLASFAVDEPDVKRIRDVEHPALDFLNVRFLLTEPDVKIDSPQWVHRYANVDGNIYESTDAWRRFFTVPAESGCRIGRIVQRGSRAFTVDVDSAETCLIGSSQLFSRDWVVTAGGTRLRNERVHGAFLGFIAPSGKNRIVIAYEPRSFRYGLIGTVTALAVLVILLKRRRSPSG